MNVFLRPYVIDIINDKLDLLDNSGLWDFLQSVISDEQFSPFLYEDAYTLALFVMKLFNDDLDEVVNTLISEGWHQWSHLDKWNNYMREGPDIQAVYEYLFRIDAGLPSMDNVGKDSVDKYIKINYNKYKDKVDFTCSARAGKILSLPIIRGKCIYDKIPDNLRDSLYVGVVDEELDGGKQFNSPWYAFTPYLSDNQERIVGEPMVFMTLSTFMEKYEELCNLFFPTVCTALPLEIVKKYNLPIYEGV